jgi:hypothetical protein
VGDRVEVALQVGINDMCVTGLEKLVHAPQGVFAAPLGAKGGIVEFRGWS